MPDCWPGRPIPPDPTGGLVVIVAAGTSDLRVAREAMLTAQYLGRECELVVDVGVAGLHRVLRRLDLLRRARVVVVVAGMDGALPSVVAGLITAPVVAVPTSVGYGAAFEGLEQDQPCQQKKKKKKEGVLLDDLPVERHDGRDLERPNPCRCTGHTRTAEEAAEHGAEVDGLPGRHLLTVDHDHRRVAGGHRDLRAVGVRGAGGAQLGLDLGDVGRGVRELLLEVGDLPWSGGGSGGGGVWVMSVPSRRRAERTPVRGRRRQRSGATPASLLDQRLHLGREHPVGGLGVDAVVDGEVPGGADRAHELDRHLTAQPGRGRRAEQYVDRHLGQRQRVAGVVMPGRRRSSGSRSCRAGQLRVDHVVQLAHRADRHAGLSPDRERRAGRHRRGALRNVRCVRRELLGDLAHREYGVLGGRRLTGCRWSGCRCVTSTAVAPATASGSVKTPGSRTTACPSCSIRTQAWPNFVMRMVPSLGSCARAPISPVTPADHTR